MKPSSLFQHSLKREWQWLKHSRWDFAMIWWLPLASILFVWWLFSPQLPHKLPIGVWDQDHSSVSRQINRFLDASPGLSVAAQFSDAREAEAALRQGQVYAVVYLPYNLAKTLKNSQHADVILNVNAQFGTHAGLIQRDVMTVVGTVSAGIQIKARSARGQAPQQASDSFTPIKANTTALFNVASDYQQFLASMIMPALLHIFAVTAGAYTVGRELRDYGMTIWLTPMGTAQPTKRQLILALLGKLTPASLSLGVVSIIVLLLAALPQSVSLSAWILVLLGLWLLLLLSLLLGAFLALLTLSLRMALSGTGFITAPAFAFSGTGFPLLAMSGGAYVWAVLLPYTHYARLQVQQLQMQAPASFALPTLLALSLACLAFIPVCGQLLKRALNRPEKWGGR